MDKLSEKLEYIKGGSLEKQLLFEMFLIRKTEETIEKLFTQGKISGTCHCSIGQEANAVGIINNLNPEDSVFSNHRGHGHFISFTKNLKGLILEVIGHKDGVCGGRGGSQHLQDGNFFSNGITGGMIPIAVGAAFANKLHKTNHISVIFLGDGATSQGVFYESMNIASLWNLPILFVIENNQYAMSTSILNSIAGDLKKRGEPFNIETTAINHIEVHDLYIKSGKIIECIRKNQRPHIIILDTYRFCGHSKSDKCVYRTSDEEENWHKKDPLLAIEKHFSSEEIKEMKNSVHDIIAEIINNSERSFED